MRWQALVSDYDGTLAAHGRVAAPVIKALERWRAAGGKAVLVSGRQLEDLQKVFPRLDLFDRAVLENGALLYRSEDGSMEILTTPPPPSLLRTLAERGVEPLSIGRVIVATDLPCLEAVRSTVLDLGLSFRIILNKGAVMLLPAGVDKASGMRAALQELGMTPTVAVGIGDAENDESFLRVCGKAVAVADALESVRRITSQVTVGGAGAGVIELIDRLLSGGE